MAGFDRAPRCTWIRARWPRIGKPVRACSAGGILRAGACIVELYTPDDAPVPPCATTPVSDDLALLKLGTLLKLVP